MSEKISPLAPLGRNDSRAKWCERCFAPLNMTCVAFRITRNTEHPNALKRLTVILRSEAT